ncbi:MAG: SIMPL domain-containing protein [Candidatus Roizmanbacteria bacterium]
MNTKLVKTYAAIVIITICGLVVIEQLGISYPVTITNQNRSSEFYATGEGKVDVVPTDAEIRIGVSVEKAPDAADAKKQLDLKNNAIIAALEKAGVKKIDIRTDSYSVFPSYEANGKAQTYIGNVMIHVMTKQKNKVGELSNIATQAGANQIFGVEYKMADKSIYKDQAREKAIKDAKKQAEKLAKMAGIHLGKVTNISEYSPDDQPPFQPYEAKLNASPDQVLPPVPSIEPGKDTVTVSVTLTYEIR